MGRKSWGARPPRASRHRAAALGDRDRVQLREGARLRGRSTPAQRRMSYPGAGGANAPPACLELQIWFSAGCSRRSRSPAAGISCRRRPQRRERSRPIVHPGRTPTRRTRMARQRVHHYSPGSEKRRSPGSCWGPETPTRRLARSEPRRCPVQAVQQPQVKLPVSSLESPLPLRRHVLCAARPLPASKQDCGVSPLYNKRPQGQNTSARARRHDGMADAPA
jgi:hypothetical protein